MTIKRGSGESFLEWHERIEREHPWKVLPRFADGALGRDYTRDRIGVVVDGAGGPVTPDEHDADDPSVWRRAEDVVGWAVVCTGTSHRSALPVLARLDRARTAGDEVEDESYHAPWLSDVVRLGERADVAAAAGIWRDQHLAELDTIRGLADAYRREREARRQVAFYVSLARGQGRSWTEIGDAVGLTRQGARQRWAEKLTVTTATTESEESR